MIDSRDGNVLLSSIPIFWPVVKAKIKGFLERNALFTA